MFFLCGEAASHAARGLHVSVGLKPPAGGGCGGISETELNSFSKAVCRVGEAVMQAPGVVLLDEIGMLPHIRLLEVEAMAKYFSA
jgi:hypothetical protein